MSPDMYGFGLSCVGFGMIMGVAGFVSPATYTWIGAASIIIGIGIRVFGGTP